MQINTISVKDLQSLRGLSTEAGARYLCQHSPRVCAVKCGGVWHVLVDEEGELLNVTPQKGKETPKNGD